MRDRAIVKSLRTPALVLALLQCGCISSRIAPTVISYNLAVEQAQNEMLLLNMVRAAKWQPMYLTDISKITGSIKRDLTATLTVPFGRLHGGSAANFSGAPGGTYSVNPTFDVNVLNTQDFMKGFLQPLTPELFAYFWNQGWPAALLLNLFVQQVDQARVDPTTGEQQKLPSYYNSPSFGPDNSKLKDFGAWVTTFLEKKPRFVTCEPQDVGIGPELPADKLLDLNALVAVADEGLSLEKVNQAYQLKRVKQEVKLEIPPSKSSTPPKSSTGGKTSCPTEKTGVEGDLAKPSVQVRALDSETGIQVSLQLRSPEDVLYYLGQIVRMETHSQNTAQLALGRSGGPYETAPLFVAFPQNRTDASGKPYPTCKAVVTVTDAEGERYIIPAAPWPPKTFATIPVTSPDTYVSALSCDPGMSVDVLSIITQLIALHKSAKDFPTTGLVRVIGQ